MNATPARKNSRCVISTAATTFSTSPVIEIAFGVRRDSISRLAHVRAQLGRGLRRADPSSRDRVRALARGRPLSGRAAARRLMQSSLGE